MVTAEAPAPAGLELLERSLAWTGVALGAVSDDLAGAPTPCVGWTLLDLLRHMVDSLSTLAEAATGRVELGAVTVDPTASPEELTRRLRMLGCSVLGGWVHAGGGPVTLDRRLVAVPAPVLTEVGALEVAVHGWDVARACGGTAELPPLLAAALLPVAARRVGPDDRPGRFGAALRDPLGTDPASLLLAHLGRRA